MDDCALRWRNVAQSVTGRAPLCVKQSSQRTGSKGGACRLERRRTRLASGSPYFRCWNVWDGSFSSGITRHGSTLQKEKSTPRGRRSNAFGSDYVRHYRGRFYAPSGQTHRLAKRSPRQGACCWHQARTGRQDRSAVALHQPRPATETAAANPGDCMLQPDQERPIVQVSDFVLGRVTR